MKVHCPICELPPDATVDTLPALALIESISPDGEITYDGETTVYWDAQETLRNNAGAPLLHCPNDHEWFEPLLIRNNTHA